MVTDEEVCNANSFGRLRCLRCWSCSCDGAEEGGDCGECEKHIDDSGEILCFLKKKLWYRLVLVECIIGLM